MSPRIQHSGHEPGEAWGKRRKVATDHEEDRDRSQHVEGSQPLSCLAESDSAASWLGRRGGMHGRLRVPAGGPLGPLCRGSCFHACIPEEPGSGTSRFQDEPELFQRPLSPVRHGAQGIIRTYTAPGYGAQTRKGDECGEAEKQKSSSSQGQGGEMSRLSRGSGLKEASP